MQVRRIDVRCRLIREDDSRAVDERARDCDTLALSAGKFVRLMLPVFPQLDILQCALDEFLPLAPIFFVRRKGYSTFSYAERTGIRLNVWKMKPSFSRRTR